MVQGRHIGLFMAAVLLATATGYAGMTPVSGFEAGHSESPPFYGPLDCRLSDLDSPLGTLAGSFPLALDLLPDADTEQAGDIQAIPITADGQDSLSLCLYALLGLGLGRSAPFVKKLHIGCIPDWYHSGGPFQIGHSQVMEPDCLCHAPVYCFIQPDNAAGSPLPRYRCEAIVCLWRTSQYTPAVLASRAPPSDAHESVSV